MEQKKISVIASLLSTVIFEPSPVKVVVLPSPSDVADFYLDIAFPVKVDLVAPPADVALPPVDVALPPPADVALPPADVALPPVDFALPPSAVVIQVFSPPELVSLLMTFLLDHTLDSPKQIFHTKFIQNTMSLRLSR